MEETGKTVRLDDPARPFFFMTHSRPVAPLRKRVSANRNADSFFGHNHWSIANWNMAYLYYGRLPCFECASCEPRGCSGLAGDAWITKAKQEGREKANTGKGRQGYVVRMYDDMMVLELPVRGLVDGACCVSKDYRQLACGEIGILSSPTLSRRSLIGCISNAPLQPNYAIIHTYSPPGNLKLANLQSLKH